MANFRASSPLELGELIENAAREQSRGRGALNAKAQSLGEVSAALGQRCEELTPGQEGFVHAYKKRREDGPSQPSTGRRGNATFSIDTSGRVPNKR